MDSVQHSASILAAVAWRRCHPLTTEQEVSQWLGLSIRQLLWFADRRQLTSKHDNLKLRHYRHRLLQKSRGEYRLIEAPKPRLKAIQRRILEDILNHVPPHEASHGFRRGRSIFTFAKPHSGSAVVVKMDLQDFFPSIRVAQVQSIFRFLGYPETVADLLAGICTTSTPDDVWHFNDQLQTLLMQRMIWRYRQPHLPQGAPTSPALANLCAYRLDCRLAALATRMNAKYTRYADDLAFSGDNDFARSCQRLIVHVGAIVIDEGFTVHFRKSRIMKQAARQKIAGIIVNQRLNISRADYDRLKAILTNCMRHGPASQNREGHPEYRSHLEGRVSFVEQIHPERGQRLRTILESIDWST